MFWPPAAEAAGKTVYVTGREAFRAICPIEQNKNFVQYRGEETALRSSPKEFAQTVMTDYRTEAPPVLRDFLAYHETVKAHSKRTVDEYFLDLRN